MHQESPIKNKWSSVRCRGPFLRCTGIRSKGAGNANGRGRHESGGAIACTVFMASKTISQAPSLAGHCLLPALRPACSAGYSLPDSPCGFCANYPHSRLCGIHGKNRMASPIDPTNSQKTSTWALRRQVPDLYGVADGARTHDNRNHNPGLYQLSYSHRRA